MGDTDLYAGNTARMWAGLVPWVRVAPATTPGLLVVDIPAQRATRLILRRPLAGDSAPIGELMRQARERGRVVVEDSFGELVLPAADGITVDRYPLMIRPPGPVVPPSATREPGGTGPSANGAGVRIVQAADPEVLAQAERVMVEGFPRRALQPFRPGCMLPPLVLAAPGWRVWLAYRDGELLYYALGFQAITNAAWYRGPATGSRRRT